MCHRHDSLRNSGFCWTWSWAYPEASPSSPGSAAPSQREELNKKTEPRNVVP